MNLKEILSEFEVVHNHIKDKNLSEAFDILKILAESSKKFDFTSQLSNYQETYKNILKYSFEYGEDPEKEMVYFRLVKSLTELADEIKEELIIQSKQLTHYNTLRKSRFELQQIEEETAKWMQKISLVKDVEKLMEGELNLPGEENSLQKTQVLTNQLFTSLWMSDKLTERQIKIIHDSGKSKDLPWYFKSLIVSAITLSMIRHFDIEKLNLLFEYYQHDEHQVWERSLIGILLVLYIHDKRIHLYPEIEQRIKSFNGDKKWNKTIEIIVIQFLRARETEKIAKKLRDEIIPEIMKSQSKLGEKLNMDELLKENMLEDKNPEWENFFEDSPDLYNKIEEFSNLQMEGSDVFLSAFAMLKNFPFFSQPGNWFLPFYKENKLLNESFEGLKDGFDSKTFLSGLQNTRFLCNSDKYSFCLNVKHMPAVQRSMMIEFFNMELEAMNEMAGDDEIVQSGVQTKTVIVQYIQDLYRFYRLHPYKKEFDDIFEMALDFHNTSFFQLTVEDKGIIRNIGEFYFEKEHLQEALDVFTGLDMKGFENELAEKAAYCHQRLGNYKEALEYYKKAELSSKPRSWLQNKIAYCYRKLGDLKSAVEYYRQSEKLEPENLFIQTSLGQVFMDMDDFETALKYFYKVEYLAPDNTKVHRPIGWCSFVLGKPEKAKKYFEKVISKEGNQYDYMNLGHVFWVLNEKSRAIENYQLSLNKSGNEFDWFDSIMMEDSEYLKSYKIPEFDIYLMLDYLKMNKENKK